MIRALILAIVLFLIGTTIAINNYIKTQDQVPSSKEVFQPDEFHVSSQITIGQRTQPQFHETIVHAIPSLRSKNVLFVQQKLQCRINTTVPFNLYFFTKAELLMAATIPSLAIARNNVDWFSVNIPYSNWYESISDCIILVRQASTTPLSITDFDCP